MLLTTPPIPDTYTQTSAPQPAIYQEYEAQNRRNIDDLLEELSLGEYKVESPLDHYKNIIKKAIDEDGYIIEEQFVEKEENDTYLLFVVKHPDNSFNPIKYAIELGNKLDDAIPENLYINIL